MLEKSKNLDSQESKGKKALLGKQKSSVVESQSPTDKITPFGADSILLRLPPKIQSNIDQILKTIEIRPISLTDLSSLGYRILKHVTEITETIKTDATTTSTSRSSKK